MYFISCRFAYSQKILGRILFFYWDFDPSIYMQLHFIPVCNAANAYINDCHSLCVAMSSNFRAWVCELGLYSLIILYVEYNVYIL